MSKSSSYGSPRPAGRGLPALDNMIRREPKIAGHCRRFCLVLVGGGWLVGATGFEPVTSRLSGLPAPLPRFASPPIGAGQG
jgi:hypothetical protein